MATPTDSSGEATPSSPLAAFVRLARCLAEEARQAENAAAQTVQRQQ